MSEGQRAPYPEDDLDEYKPPPSPWWLHGCACLAVCAAAAFAGYEAWRWGEEPLSSSGRLLHVPLDALATLIKGVFVVVAVVAAAVGALAEVAISTVILALSRRFDGGYVLFTHGGVVVFLFLAAFAGLALL